VIGVVDYGVGNLQSVVNALDRLSLPYAVCRRPEEVAAADRLLLPGVGHFGAAARAIEANGVAAALREAALAGKPLVGICLGMQLLLEGSDEAPGARGLGLLPGKSVALEAKRVPHMGWNLVRWNGRRDHYYFAHGFVAAPRPEHVVATTELEGTELPAAIGRDRIVGVQFHPEKSGDRGLALLEELCRC